MSESEPGLGLGTGAQIADAAMPMAAPHADTHNTLQAGKLHLPDVLAQSVTVMAPAMSGGFITYLAAIKAGGATPLSFLLATLAVLLIGTVVAAFASAMKTAGSLYTYTVKGIGAFWGYLTAWGYTAGLWLAGPSVLAGSAVFLSLVLEDIGAPSILTHWMVWFGLGLVLWYFIGSRDVKLTTRLSLVGTLVGMGVLGLVAVIVIAKGGAHGNTLDAFSPSAAGVHWPGVFAGVAFGLLSFTGFETAANLAEETRNPHRAVPQAVLGAVAIGGVFYVLVTYATSIGYGVQEATTKWPESASGLAPVADIYAPHLSNWVLLFVAFDAFFCGLALSNAVSRIMFAMARDGVLPRALARTHPKHKTPYIALLTYIAGAIVFVAVLLLLTSQTTQEALAPDSGNLTGGFYIFTEGLTLITPPIMLGYVMLSIAGLCHGAREHRPVLMIVSVLSCGAAIVAVVGSLWYSFVEAAPGAGIPTPYAVIPWLLAGWLVVGALIAWWLRSRRPAAWQGMGSVFE